MISMARLSRYIWSFPTTMFGLLFIPLALVSKGNLRIVAGVLEIHGGLVAAFLKSCVPLRCGASALTLGHVVLGRDPACLDATRRHERVHVRQCELWGPAFLPAYCAASLWALLHGKDPYRDNYFERQAIAESIAA